MNKGSQGLFILTLLILMALTSTGGSAQEENSSTIISAANIQQLQPVHQIDYATDLREVVRAPDSGADDAPIGPSISGEFNSGWFTTDIAANFIAIMQADGTLRVINREGELYYELPAPRNELNEKATLIDATFNLTSATSGLFAVYSDGIGIFVRQADGQTDGNPLIDVTLLAEYIPQSIWVDCPDPLETTYNCTPYIEVFDPTDGSQLVVRAPSQADLMSGQMPAQYRGLDALQTLPYAPGQDETALVRIGRIEPPDVVTSSPEGLVKRWNPSTGELVAEAQVANGPVVFGQISHNGRWLAWRGPYSETLNLLDFETGENRVVADLNGRYAQFFFVNNAGDTIIAVHLDDAPIVVAWDVASGAEFNLGQYRTCERELDMARIPPSEDMLIIGCSEGLQFWHVDEDDT